ncbi:MAG TPA: universal stress protein, UspA, partial [Candidatus Tenderia sp.]|nr:universal stress protein, UspA [Candidatus Tenderia sp.]
WEAMAESSLRGAFIDASEEQIETYVKEVQRQHKQSLEALVAEITNELGNDTLNYLKPQIQLLKGSPRKEIPAFTQQIEADLVIMGTVARTGIPGLFMGNTAETILNRLNCSVLAIKPPGFVTPVSY